MARGKNSVPDRWHDYQPLKKCIVGTKFLPIKVPLREKICANMKEEERFRPCDFLEILADKKLTLGLIIDLTNTTRYYNPEEFSDRGIKYVKIFTEGHSVPSNDVCSRFSNVVKDFEDANSSNDFVIAVHCTHGVNRTGYLICRYMIENLSFSPEEAIKGFKEARGHEIERENYIDSLHSLTSTSLVQTSEEPSIGTEDQMKRKSPSMWNYELTSIRWSDRSVHELACDSYNSVNLQQHGPSQHDDYYYRQRNESFDTQRSSYQNRTSSYTRNYRQSYDYDCQEYRTNYYRYDYGYQDYGPDYKFRNNSLYDDRECVDLFRFHNYREHKARYNPYSWRRSDNRQSLASRKWQASHY